VKENRFGLVVLVVSQCEGRAVMLRNDMGKSKVALSPGGFFDADAWVTLAKPWRELMHDDWRLQPAGQIDAGSRVVAGGWAQAMVDVSKQELKSRWLSQTCQDGGERQRIGATGKSGYDARFAGEVECFQAPQDTLFEACVRSCWMGLRFRLAAHGLGVGVVAGWLVPTGGLEPPTKGL
jgi:hypothetical protein